MRELGPLEVQAAKRERHRQAGRALERQVIIMLFGVGGLLACFALVCFALGFAALVTGRGLASVLGAGALGLLVWTPLAWLTLGRGVDYVRENKLEARLRAVGIAGRAVIVAFHESIFNGFRVDTKNRVTLTLQIDVAGRPPYTVVCTKYPSMYWDPVQGEGLGVLVDPSNPQGLILDWQRSDG